ncbi:hypothetical protein HAU32_07710 [Weissella confusa]|uniref:Uncharacterized protein n=1 Tax=Weissella fermenti TaxID=2987699 RepID=A0ABT6D3I2_9LACO|nr:MULTISPECIES: hypothetical protein [Weissella]MBJ7688858.1 hypothetical protein [Weissella confusa]MCW0927222.1 hypothetical protein [Weissella sp. LMG 11983]MDF9299663.1 hypothetical protein [Weissella sp. BK2]
MKKIMQWGIGILGVAAAVGIGYIGMGLISDAHSTDKVTTNAKQQASSEQQTNKPKQQKTIFQQIAGRDFWFTSGAGGWRTVMTINEDGTFSGKFTDSDMGDSGTDYPKGSMKISEFTGRLDNVQKVSATAYTMTVSQLDYNPANVTTIVDGVREITAEPYGIGLNDAITIYLPGQEVDRNDATYRMWLGTGGPYGDTTAFIQNEKFTLPTLFDTTQHYAWIVYPASQV